MLRYVAALAGLSSEELRDAPPVLRDAICKTHAERAQAAIATADDEFVRWLRKKSRENCGEDARSYVLCLADKVRRGAIR